MSEAERAGRYTDLFASGTHDHQSDCAFCPICTGIAVLRESNPEVVEHLAAAARELIAAAGILVAETEKRVGRPAPPDQGATDGRVRRIDVG
ncbi:MAG TPA: DUF5304 family protein [Actinomycetota bacterium]|nr:DUF5304 family protein [Actinomycetota bacterium]